jgi:hypothetical protein
MKRFSNHKKFPVPLVLLTIILVFVILLGCTKIDENTPVESVDKKNFPDQESWKSEITITKDGKRFAQIWAGYIAFYNEKPTVSMRIFMRKMESIIQRLLRTAVWFIIRPMI